MKIICNKFFITYAKFYFIIQNYCKAQVNLNPRLIGYFPLDGNANDVSGSGNNYTWSPSTGLNTTTGALVLCNTISTTTYTVKKEILL
jgi:hypothetical protein